MNWKLFLAALTIIGLCAFGLNSLARRSHSSPAPASADGGTTSGDKSDSALRKPNPNPEHSTSSGSPTDVDNLLGDLWGGDISSLSSKSAPGLTPIHGAPGFELGSYRGRSTESIESTIRQHVPGLKKIFRKRLKLHPGFKGKVTFHFTIAPSGRIVDLKIISSTTGNDEFDNEITVKIKRWRFGPIKEKGDDVVTVPFNFSE